MSFGADEDAVEEEPVVFKKKPIVRPDCAIKSCLSIRAIADRLDSF